MAANRKQKACVACFRAKQKCICVPQAKKWWLLIALRVQQPQQRRALAAAVSDIQAAMACAAGDSDSDAEFIYAPAAADVSAFPAVAVVVPALAASLSVSAELLAPEFPTPEAPVTRSAGAEGLSSQTLWM
ncbi:uncharacterized protein ACLA_014340 [Aspergillus clavatus NRRL 1]|uniref:Uncharacterized protein n=1 Tax=Aspergillus clavatus (strain ATCC 1007 / CBS 513.65 / DSM 816 / NCTC 3887 / NRRL 1 / QM 1276 / 107) TaxID=344612 RepID=A1CB79_ASPCL|nr:uncharacterized protein ACLA_014340 [Aspergillus clavatus NRRL 1]EAW12997.1 hypothetical protein ACLA_014340 [Aspergillus clavatus NRRL 1]